MDTVTTLRPADLRQARDAMATLAGHRVALRGNGTAANWVAPVPAVDAVLETAGMREVLDYQPRDMTVAVQAGLPLATLQGHLAGHGQRIALDPARIAAGATVGGLLATADAGPLRHSYGAPRDLVLGATVVLADATVARSGGHVIKNVAGYDLARLFSGSYGTLGLLAELVLRVHPVPAASATLAVPAGCRQACAVAADILAEPLEPEAVEWCDGRLLVRFTGHPAGVVRRADRGCAIAGTRAEILRDAGEDAAWQLVAEHTAGEPGDTVLRAGMLPARLPDAADRLAALADAHEVRATLVSSVGVGVHTARIAGGTAADHAAVVSGWRTELAGLGGTTSLRRRRDGFGEHAASWGPPPPAVAALRAVKDAFDPEHRLEPGRFAPWF